VRRQSIIAGAAAAAAMLPVLLVGVAPAHAAATEQLRLAFDDAPSGQSEPGPWTGGCFADSAAPPDQACIAVGTAGSVGRLQRPSGSGTSPAIAFPAPGTGRAMLEIPHAAALNPGSADFTVSAMVRLTSAQASPGANIVQKGLFATAGGQWKLQIDGGVPSCRIAGTRAGAAVSALVSADVSIADAGWTFVQCKRRGSVLSITVGNRTPVPAGDDATMEISNTSKVTVGAKGTGSSNDQFHGALDNVVLSIG
jgi:hypothetical protein